MLETLLREMDEEGGGDEGGETVVHDNDQARKIERKHFAVYIAKKHPRYSHLVFCVIVR